MKQATKASSARLLQLSIPPKRLLVPMNADDTSMAAWNYAQLLSRRLGAQAQPFHVEAIVFPMVGMTVVEPAWSMEALEDSVRQLRQRLGSHVTVETEVGAPVLEISRRAAAFDLVVMGTSARQGMDRALLGSVAEAVMRRSATPVLVVPRPYARLSSILAPVNFEPYAWETFVAAATMARACGASLTALHVVEGTLARGAAFEGPKRLLDEWVANLPEDARPEARPELRVEVGPAPEAIVRAAGKHDLIALAAHRRGLIKDAFGTTAERVLRHSPIPVLAVPTTPGRLQRGRRWRRASARPRSPRIP